MSTHPDGPGSATPLLAIEALTVTVGGRDVVDGVGLRVGPGERVALLGPSGSGKSLTAAAVLGRLPAVASLRGRVLLGGTDVGAVPAARRDRAVRLAAVGQDTRTALNPLVAVGTQLRAAVRANGGDDRPGALREALAATGIEDPGRVLGGHPGELSGGQRQRVQLALALACRPHLLVADEPTTALDPVNRRRVLDLLASGLAGSGTALLFISHDTAAAHELCDRAVHLRGGRVVDPAPLPAHTPRPAPAASAGPGGPLLVARGLHRVHPGPGRSRPAPVPALRGVDLTVHAGERVALAGTSGAGKSTLLRILLALEPADAGSVTADGADVRPGPVRRLRAFRRAVQYVPQDPAGSLDPRMTARELVAEPLRRLGGPATRSAAGRTRAAAAALDDVGLPAALADRRPGELSGGQAQRVALARALVVGPRLLLADEPVSGLDPALRDQVVDLLADTCAAHGTGLLLVSHDLAVAAALCPRTVVLHDGLVVEDRPTVELLAAPQHPAVAALVDAAAPLSV